MTDAWRQDLRQRRSASFRASGLASAKGIATSPSARQHQESSPKRFSFSDAPGIATASGSGMSATTRQRSRILLAPPGGQFDRRLEDSLRDLRVMQARMSRNPAGGGKLPAASGQQQPQQQQQVVSPHSTSPEAAQLPEWDGSPRPPMARQRAMSLATAGFGGREIVAAERSSLTSLVMRNESTSTVNSSRALATTGGGGGAMETSHEMTSSGSKLAGSCGGAAGDSSVGGAAVEFRRDRRRASMQDAIDATKINADLYCNVYNQPNAIQSIQEENLGQLNFSVSYREDTGILTVRIIQAIDLQPKDSSTGSANPYCRVALLPSRKTQTTTKIHKKTLRPEFEEEFIFEASQNELQWSVLEITVFDYDPCSLDDCLGQVKLPLVELVEADLIADVQTLWKGLVALERDRDPEHKIGDLMFSLSFLPAARRLIVSIIKARNLRDIPRDKPLSDTSARVTLSTQSGRQRRKRKKTSCCKTPSHPEWEEALVFNSVTEEDLRSGCLVISVCREGLLTSTEIGRVYLGLDTSGQEYQHWSNMLKSKGAPARWHRLVSPPPAKGGEN